MRLAFGNRGATQDVLNNSSLEIGLGASPVAGACFAVASHVLPCVPDRIFASNLNSSDRCNPRKCITSYSAMARAVGFNELCFV